MEAGYTTAILGNYAPPPYDDSQVRLVFVVPGERTAANPVAAFKQGLREAAANDTYVLKGYRCPACGRVELVAGDNAS